MGPHGPGNAPGTVPADPARRTKERDDEFWYLGEEIAAYRALLEARPGAEAHRAAVDRRPW